jgi:hypothetical protein
MNISKGHTIRQGPYSLEHLSLSQGHLNGVLTPWVGQLQKSVKGEWHPWRTECALKGTSWKKKLNQRRVTPLEHGVCLEGHVVEF